jgi:tetratricopeptide (TPR) repeat protein
MRPWQVALSLALVLAAAAAAYRPAVDGDLLFDDTTILADARVRAPMGVGLAAWLAAPRPVTAATFALQAALGGLAPRPLHLGNLLLHLAAVLLAFALSRETLRRAGLASPEGPALAAAALFALHPLQSGAVASVVQRAEVLASALTMAALLLLLRRDPALPARRRPLAAGALLLHALALGAKPVAATLPALWLLHAALLPPPGEAATPVVWRLRPRLPLALALLALSAVAAWSGLAAAAGSPHAGFSVPGLSVTDYLATQLRVVPGYLRLLLWPAGQCGDWFVAPSRSFLEPAVLAGGLLLAALVAGALRLARRAGGQEGDAPALARTTAFGLLFFLQALAPSSSVIPLLDAKAEHRVYLALLGPALALAAAATVALRRRAPGRAPALGVALGVAVCGAAALATWQRSAVWATTLGFWTDAAVRSPEKARVQLNLGVALSDAGRPAESLAALRQASRLRGDGTVSSETLLLNLVTGFLTAGLPDEARAEVEAELAHDPGSAVAWGQLARLEYAAGRDEACERAAATALAQPASRQGVPDRGIALKWLGLCRLGRGDAAGAVPILRQADGALPGEYDLLWSLGQAEQVSGDRPAACRSFARAAAVAPGPAQLQQVRQRAARAGCGAP